jgi:hypothetical protein
MSQSRQTVTTGSHSFVAGIKKPRPSLKFVKALGTQTKKAVIFSDPEINRLTAVRARGP